MMDRKDSPDPSSEIPANVRPKHEAITALADAFCKRHRNEEYAETSGVAPVSMFITTAPPRLEPTTTSG